MHQQYTMSRAPAGRGSISLRPVTPRGFRDALPQEAAEREWLVRAMSGAMESWGYGPVETPVAEEYATLEAGAGGSLEGTAFRLFDSDGRLLALRPEMTIPIARLAATRFGDERGPLRLRYAADVFREQASMRGQARQFTQVGLEFIGAGGPGADAEVIGALVEMLRATGLTAFTVGVGTVEVLHAIIESAGMDAAWGGDVLAASHDRNLVGIDALAAVRGVAPAAAAALAAVPRIRGSREAIDACRAAAAGCGVDAALDALAETWELLESIGAADNVTVDFGIMRSFDYYSGIVLEVYAPGLGLPLGGGGRYDDVMATFASPQPAAGFAVGVERLHIALAEQGVAVPGSSLDAVLGGDPRATFAAAATLRRAGWRVRQSTREGLELIGEAQSVGAPEALAVAGGRIVRLDRAGQAAEPLSEPPPAPPTRSWAAREGSR